MDPANQNSAVLPSLSFIMVQLGDRLPRNDFGLPDGIYRPDVVANLMASVDLASFDPQPEAGPTGSPSSLEETPADGQLPLDGQVIDDGNLLNVLEAPSDLTRRSGDTLSQGMRVLANLRQRDLQVALVSLSYREGFPTLPDGRPVWTFLDFEPLEAFRAFEAYIAQGQKGVRQLIDLADSPEIDFDAHELLELHALYSWDVRVKSYDLFYMAERRRLREIRAAEVDDAQYLAASALVNKASMYMDEEEFQALLTPKVALEMLKLGWQIQRVSVGLPGQGPAIDPDKVPNGAPTEFIIRQLVKSQGGSPTIQDGRVDEIYSLLEDEGNIALAQELIFKMGNR